MKILHTEQLPEGPGPRLVELGGASGSVRLRQAVEPMASAPNIPPLGEGLSPFVSKV